MLCDRDHIHLKGEKRCESCQKYKRKVPDDLVVWPCIVAQGESRCTCCIVMNLRCRIRKDIPFPWEVYSEDSEAESVAARNSLRPSFDSGRSRCGWTAAATQQRAIDPPVSAGNSLQQALVLYVPPTKRTFQEPPSKNNVFETQHARSESRGTRVPLVRQKRQLVRQMRFSLGMMEDFCREIEEADEAKVISVAEDALKQVEQESRSLKRSFTQMLDRQHDEVV
jgi:hypothetical protein